MIMLIKYVLRSCPVFVFEPCCVPAEHYLVYGVGTSIYDYLLSRLRPSDIDSVRVDTDGVNTHVAVVYRLSDDLLLNMPAFVSMDDEDYYEDY